MTTTAAALEADDCTPNVERAMGADAATALASPLKALAEPLRLRMLSAVATDPRGESCVCDLAELTDVSQPTVSHHLKVLKDAGLLASERRGTWVWYRIVPSRKHAVSALLDSFAPANLLEMEEDNADRAEALRTMDHQVTRLAEDLADELTDMNRDLVVAIVRESYVGLMRSAKLTQRIIALTERFARQRLADLTRPRASAASQVLFVCVANAGPSQLAAALLTELSGGTVVARSAGSSPAADVHPSVRKLLAEIETPELADAAFPKPLTDEAVRAADVVITMGCADVCPVIAGVDYQDWPVGDPVLASESGLAAIRDDIAARVQTLLASLTK